MVHLCARRSDITCADWCAYTGRDVRCPLSRLCVCCVRGQACKLIALAQWGATLSATMNLTVKTALPTLGGAGGIAAKLALSASDVAAYDTLWHEADTVNELFPAGAAVTFLGTSGLPQADLREIWGAAALPSRSTGAPAPPRRPARLPAPPTPTLTSFLRLGPHRVCARTRRHGRPPRATGQGRVLPRVQAGGTGAGWQATRQRPSVPGDEGPSAQARAVRG